MKLDPRASAAGVRLLAHDALGSTNAEALTLARQGERGPLWVTARRQTAGRGRRGRSWVSEPGNLYATLLLTAPSPSEHWPELSFVAALAIHDAIVEVAADLKPRLAIKWPNDLLLAGAKFAGILIEGEASRGDQADGDEGAVVVGIGVNCASHPADTEYPATDLAAAGAPRRSRDHWAVRGPRRARRPRAAAARRQRDHGRGGRRVSTHDHAFRAG